jgi:L-threonylcarbamoyladenylate synthase
VTALDDAAGAIEEGSLVVIPTDTVYGIACRPDDPAATDRLFGIKRRPRDLELPVLVSSIEVAGQVAQLDERSRRLMEAFWPGPLTVVLPRAVPARRWDLGGDAHTVGVREPRHLLALALLERSGPLAVTSANLSGTPSPESCEELHAVFGEGIAVYLCQEEPLSGHPSTVVDLTHEEVRVLRAGSVTERDLSRVLASGT